MDWIQSRLKMAVCIFFFCQSLLYAQESVNASGNTATGSGGTASYTVGQLAYESAYETEGSVAQGIQQAYEISEVIVKPSQNLATTHDITLKVTVDQDQNSDVLILNITGFNETKMAFQLFSVQGRLLQNIAITHSQTSIDMSSLAPATFYAKVIQGNSAVKTFKVIKN